MPASVLLAPSRTTESAPLGETPLGETPLGETPLGETPLGEPARRGRASASTTSSRTCRRCPVVAAAPPRGRLAGVLAPTSLANRVLQNVSLGDVFALTPRPPVLDGQGNDDITLADLDYSRSSLGDVVAIAALGSGVTLADLSGPSRTASSIRAPELVHDHEHVLLADVVLSLGLKGAPLGETPRGNRSAKLLWDTPPSTARRNTADSATPRRNTPRRNAAMKRPLRVRRSGETPPRGDRPEPCPSRRDAAR